MSSIQSRLQEFESGLDPTRLETSIIPCKILGFGEISTVLEVNGLEAYAAKRMPLFHAESEAQKYIGNYRQYCNRLREAGLQVPEDETILVEGQEGITVLYILQKQLPSGRFCHKLLHSSNDEMILSFIPRVITEIEKVWSFNEENKPELRLAIDGQISNWVYLESDELLFIDTSTPLMHERGAEVLDPELLLQSAPSFMRWLIRLFFLKGVMERYYDRRLVYTDLIANLFKEQRSDLVDACIDQINSLTGDSMIPLERKTIESYYREDKLIWRLFLGLRRLDRFIKVKLLRSRYEFVLPGRIDR